MKDEEKCFEYVYGIVFFFGDLNCDGVLIEEELRRLFLGNVFVVYFEDFICVLLLCDFDNS